MIPGACRAAALCAVAATLGAGCSDLPDGPAGTPPPTRGVSSEQIAATPAGSPQRALLEWLRHMKRAEITAALNYYDDSVKRVNETTLGFRRKVTSQLWRYLGSPRILDVDRHGRKATVYTMMDRELKAPNGRIDVTRRPRAFHLRKTGGRWKLSDNLFLIVSTESGALL